MLQLLYASFRSSRQVGQSNSTTVETGVWQALRFFVGPLALRCLNTSYAAFLAGVDLALGSLQRAAAGWLINGEQAWCCCSYGR